MLKKIVLFAALLMLIIASFGCQADGKYKNVFDEDGRIIARDFERIVHIDQPSRLKPR